MIAEIERHRDAVAALCARFHVRRLDLFGSAAREAGFGPDSDVDLIVDYEPGHAPPSLGDFLALRDGLAAVFGRAVDLIVDGAVRNPFVLASIERSRRTLHGA